MVKTGDMMTLLSRLVKKSVLDDDIVSSRHKKSFLPDDPDGSSRHLSIYSLLGKTNKP